MDIQFYKGSSKPESAPVGSIYFNDSTKRIELITDVGEVVYGSELQDASVLGSTLTITKIDGTKVEVNLGGSISDVESALNLKLNKIKVNNTAVNNINLNFVGNNGVKITENSGSVTFSVDTIDASKITSGIIDIARIPKAALERLFIVKDEQAALSVGCQEGDTVQVTGAGNRMYFCVNSSATTFSAKFHEYTAGSASTVPWSGIIGKPTIPSKVSQLENDSKFLKEIPIASAANLGGIKVGAGLTINSSGVLSATGGGTADSVDWKNVQGKPTTFTPSAHTHTLNDVTNLSTTLNNKVDKDGSKVLSTNDFTNTYKTKLDGLSNYSLPTASAKTLGGVKVGSGLAINNGVLSATGGGTADSVDWSNVQNKPTKLSQFTNDTKFITTSALTNYALKSSIPSKTSDLNNDSGFITSSDVNETSINNSTGNFTLGTGLSLSGKTINCTVQGGGNYTLPIASSSTLGGVMPGRGMGMFNGPDTNYNTGNPTDNKYLGVNTGYGITTDAYGSLCIYPTEVNIAEFKGSDNLVTTTDIPVKSVNGLTGEVVIPTATSESLGTVKVGYGLSIDSNGVLSTTVVVPTKVSDLTNDSGFITETSLSGYAKTSDIPTKVSQLNNDVSYAKTSDIPTESTIKSMFSTETWTFTMENGKEVTKTIYIA